MYLVIKCFYSVGHFSAKLLCRRIFFENISNLGLTYYSKQLKFKKLFKVLLIHLDFDTFNFSITS